MSQKTSTTHYTVVQGVAVLTMDNAPVNSLSTGTRGGLLQGLQAAQQDKSITGIIVRGAGRAFCAGAEITEFASAGSGGGGPAESLTTTLARLESASVPTIALIHGFALGGGLEVALACHYRLAAAESQVGLPEVNLGLLPGAGGTQRLPRLIGPVAAADFIIAGSPIGATKAKDLGIVDAVIPAKSTEESRLQAAIDFLRSKDGKTRPTAALPLAAPADLDAQLDKVLKGHAHRRRGELAPALIVDCVKAAVRTAPDFAAGMKEEGRLFAVLLRSSESRALQHQFFAERAASKLPKAYDVAPLPLKTIGIVGAGLMGGGIAMSCLDNGLSVVILDATQDFLDRGMKVIRANYERSVQRKSTTQARVEEALSRLRPTLAYEDLSVCDLVVEAVYEDMKLKKSIFLKLDAVCRPGAVIASNTSALNIDEIAGVTKRPEAVIGCHFFSPANVMRLLENVRGAKSSPSTIATAMAFGKQIGKVAVLVGNCPGFVGNRMLGPYTAEAFKLLHEGVRYDRVDRVAKDVIGMNMGPIAMSDLVGIDLAARQRKTAGTADPSRNVGDALFAAGRFGQKNGKGYYSYGSDRVAVYEPETTALIKKVSINLGIVQRPEEKVTDQEVMERLLLPLVNEGFKCLEEGIAQKASDIDVVYCFGYGFPKWRGGPMKWAEEIGLDYVLAGLMRYRRWGHNEHYWTPSKLLVDTVANAAHGKKSKL